MSTAVIGVLVGLGTASGWIALAVMAIRNGGLKAKIAKTESKLEKAERDRDTYSAGLHKLKNEVTTKKLTWGRTRARLQAEIDGLYDDLAACATDADGANAAHVGIRRLKRLLQNEESDDADPGADLATVSGDDATDDPTNPR